MIESQNIIVASRKSINLLTGIIFFISLIVVFLTLVVCDLYRRPREINLHPEKITKTLRPNAISKESIITHAYSVVMMVSNFNGKSIRKNMENALKLMSPQYAEQFRSESAKLIEIVEKNSVTHYFNVRGLPDDIETITDDMFWSVTLIGGMYETIGVTLDQKDPSMIVYKVLIRRAQGGSSSADTSLSVVGIEPIPYKQWEENQKAKINAKLKGYVKSNE